MVLCSMRPVLIPAQFFIWAKVTVIGVIILAQIFAIFKDAFQLSLPGSWETPPSAIPWCCNMGLVEGSFLVCKTER